MIPSLSIMRRSIQFRCGPYQHEISDMSRVRLPTSVRQPSRPSESAEIEQSGPACHIEHFSEGSQLAGCNLNEEIPRPGTHGHDKRIRSVWRLTLRNLRNFGIVLIEQMSDTTVFAAGTAVGRRRQYEHMCQWTGVQVSTRYLGRISRATQSPDLALSNDRLQPGVTNQSFLAQICRTA
jgi:hypothetical protein